MEEPLIRDKWGDAIPPLINLDKNEKTPIGTYIWQQKDSDDLFKPVYKYDAKKQPVELYEVDLVSIDINLDLKKIDNCNSIVNKYFFETLAFDKVELINGIQMEEFSRIILPKITYIEINKIITEYSLDGKEDFFLFLLVKIQTVYINHIYKTENSNVYDKYKNLGQDVKKLISVLETGTIEKEQNKLSSKKNNKINKISFGFTKEKSLHIIHPELIKNIISTQIEFWDRQYMKDWKKNLEKYSLTKEELKNGIFQEIFKFKQSLSRSLHLLFREEKLFNFNGKVTLDKEIYCIAKLMNSVNINLYSEHGEKYDIVDNKKEIITLVKSWCNRTKIERNTFGYISEPNSKKLEKYFDSEFLKACNKNINKYDRAYSLLNCEINNILDQKEEIMFLTKCIKNEFKILQLTDCKLKENYEKIEELKYLREIQSLTDNPGDLERIIFILKDKSTPLQITQEILKQIIIDAIKIQKNESVKYFDTDLFIIKEVSVDSSNELESFLTYKFSNERLLPTFCRSLYSYLLTESFPKSDEYYPSERYINIIGRILIQAGFFPYQQEPTPFINGKIKTWVGIS